MWFYFLVLILEFYTWKKFLQLLNLRIRNIIFWVWQSGRVSLFYDWLKLVKTYDLLFSDSASVLRRYIQIIWYRIIFFWVTITLRIYSSLVKLLLFIVGSRSLWLVLLALFDWPIKLYFFGKWLISLFNIRAFYLFFIEMLNAKAYLFLILLFHLWLFFKTDTQPISKIAH